MMETYGSRKQAPEVRLTPLLEPNIDWWVDCIASFDHVIRLIDSDPVINYLDSFQLVVRGVIHVPHT